MTGGNETNSGHIFGGEKEEEKSGSRDLLLYLNYSNSLGDVTARMKLQLSVPSLGFVFLV